MTPLFDAASLAGAVIGAYVLGSTLKERHLDASRGWAQRPYSRDRVWLGVLLVLGAAGWGVVRLMGAQP